MFLSKGSYGTVYRNTEGLAVKVIHHSAGEVLFPMELSLMLTYRHPYLNRAKRVTLYADRVEIEQSEARWDLGQYLTIYKPSKYLARKWMFSLFSAVGVMHRDRIVHCDIKPKNLLITANKELKLTDFGFATLLTRRVIPREPIGTLAYIAPEVLLTGILRKEADIWSSLCVCYEILTGERLIPRQISSQQDTVRHNLSLRYKTIKAIQMWRQSIGEDVDPELGNVSYLPIRNQLKLNDLGRLVINSLAWNPSQRPTVDELVQNSVFSRLERVSGKIKVLVVSTAEYEHSVHKYLQSRGLNKLDKEILTQLVSLYTRARVVVDKKVNDIVVIEATLLIVFRLFHYQYDSLCLVTDAIVIKEVTFQIYERLEFRVHTP
jgi:serine/threonine protein kinase